MKKATLLLVLVMVVGLAGGCAEDVILPPLPTLLGVYVGEYHVKDGDSPTETRKITWSFSDEVPHDRRHRSGGWFLFPQWPVFT